MKSTEIISILERNEKLPNIDKKSESNSHAKIDTLDIEVR